MVGALSSVRKKKSIPTWLVHDFRTTFRAGVPGLPRRSFLVLEAGDHAGADPTVRRSRRTLGVADRSGGRGGKDFHRGR